MELRIVLVTCPSDADGRTIAETIIKERLAACINIIPGVHSIYQWEGRLHDDREVLLIIKTAQEKLPALEAAVLAMHPYDTPEFIVLEVDGVSEKYGAWVKEVVN